MESKMVFGVLLLALIGASFALPLNDPISPSDEAKLSEPGSAAAPTGVDLTSPLGSATTLGADGATLSKPEGDLETANTLLFGLGLAATYPFWGAGYGLYGYGYPGYGYGYGYPYGHGYGHGYGYGHHYGHGYGLYRR